MKDFIKLLQDYLPPYKRYLYLSILYNFLSALFGVFSMVSMIPLLKILFGLEEKVYKYVDISSSMTSMSAFGNALKNNIYSFITHISMEQGAGTALIFIGLFLIFMVLLKVGFTYLASYSIVTLRTGVIRDIRDKNLQKNRFPADRIFYGRKERRHPGPHYRRCIRSGGFHYEFARNVLQKPDHYPGFSHSHADHELAAFTFCTDPFPPCRIRDRPDWQITETAFHERAE